MKKIEITRRDSKTSSHGKTILYVEEKEAKNVLDQLNREFEFVLIKDIDEKSYAIAKDIIREIKVSEKATGE